MNSPRRFEDHEAVREAVPLFVGLVGPSGSGKTFSALRLATGMQRVTGGDIFGIDTEARRMSHYADRFKFRRLDFEAPFDPLSYLAAVEHCVARGAKTVIVDSTSHLHEGIGGTLEAHEAELTRIAGTDFAKRERCKMLAWQKPKSELRRFLNTILQLRVNIIFCFRAKEKIKIIRGKEPEPMGFMPIAGDEMVYEMTLNCLLYPGSRGVPTWHPHEFGERTMVKLPAMFEGIFAKDQPLSEEIGEALARWSTGGEKPAAEPAQKPESRPAAKTQAPKPEPAKTRFQIALDNILSGTTFDAREIAQQVLDWAIQRQIVEPPVRLPNGQYQAASVHKTLDRLWLQREDQVAGMIEDMISNASIPTD